MTETYKGSCLCRAIEFEVDTFAENAAHCHCSMCRKFHGAEHATYVSVARQSLRFLSGQDAVQNYEASNGTTRTFCGNCGSSLFFRSPRAEPDLIEVALAAFDSEVPVTPDAHIFVGFAANWTSIEDQLPQFLNERDGALFKK